MRAIAIGLGMVLLAGCSVPMPEQENAVVADKDDGFNVVQPAAPGASDTAADRPGGLGGRIPANFAGRWGLVPSDCTAIGGDAKGLMTVEADRLSFHEARASVTNIEAVSPNEVHVALAFSGEGREWTQETPLVLEQDGNVLTRYTDGQMLRYTRCGA